MHRLLRRRKDRNRRVIAIGSSSGVLLLIAGAGALAALRRRKAANDLPSGADTRPLGQPRAGGETDGGEAEVFFTDAPEAPGREEAQPLDEVSVDEAAADVEQGRAAEHASDEAKAPEADPAGGPEAEASAVNAQRAEAP